MMWAKRLLVMSLVVLGLLLAGCDQAVEPSSAPTPVPRSSPTPRLSPAPQVGAPAPDFTLPRLGGGVVRLSDFRGSPVLLNFWTTWCPPCRAEMPLLQEVFEEKAGSGLVVLAVDLGEGESKVQSFVKSLGLTFPIALDLDGSVARAYRISPIPVTFFIDREGVIRMIRVGAFSDKAEILDGLKSIGG